MHAIEFPIDVWNYNCDVFQYGRLELFPYSNYICKIMFSFLYVVFLLWFFSFFCLFHVFINITLLLLILFLYCLLYRHLGSFWGVTPCVFLCSVGVQKLFSSVNEHITQWKATFRLPKHDRMVYSDKQNLTQWNPVSHF